VKDLPVEDNLRDMRQCHLNALIKIRGVVTKRTTVFPELKKLYYRCKKCQDVKGPYFNTDYENGKHSPGDCLICGSSSYKLADSMCVYRNF